MLLTNIRSLRYKVDELSAVIKENNIDICCVTESWLDTDIPSEAVDIDEYVIHRSDRNDGRQGGGVAVYVRSDLSCVRVNDTDTEAQSQTLETLWLLFRSKRMPRSVSHILLGTIYHPPDAPSRPMVDHILDTIDSVMKRHPSAGIMLLGDFNHMYDSSLREYPLKQIIASATRGSAVLDKIYTNVSDWYLPPKILPITAGSDHRTVLAVPVGGNVKRGHQITVTIRSTDQNGKNLLARALNNVNWSPLYHMTSVETMTEYFYTTVTCLLDKHLPARTVIKHTSNKPWVTETFCRLVRQRQYAYTHGDMTKYRMLRNQVNRLSCKLRQRFCEKRMRNLRHCNAANWWKETKRLTGQSTKSDLSGLANAECDGDNAVLADLINKSLQSVSDDLSPLTENTFATHNDVIPEQYTIYPEEVFNKLSHINTRKAPGPDNLPNWILKEFAFALCDPICCIFNTSVQQGIVPTLWKSANVTPIPKVKPAQSIQDDLRPISLTPTISKLLESLVGQWMLETVSTQFDAKQFGGIKGRSTLHALVDILQIWHTALDDKNFCRVLFIDYSKAFDHVDHTIVLNKMADMGIPNFIIQWMFSFLQQRQQRVKIGSDVSPWLTLNGGMPQGTWLGLYIFIILINDLLLNVPTHKYVDDVTLSEVLGRDEQSRMPNILQDLIEWSRENLMNINCKKTKEMLIGKTDSNSVSSLHINGQQIDRVKSFKLLGVIVTDKLNWDNNTSLICSKAGKRLHFLKLLKRSGLKTDDLLYYYTAVVRPVVEYASTVWQSSITQQQSHLLDTIQQRAEKNIGIESAGKLTPLKTS